MLVVGVTQTIPGDEMTQVRFPAVNFLASSITSKHFVSAIAATTIRSGWSGSMGFRFRISLAIQYSLGEAPSGSGLTSVIT